MTSWWRVQTNLRLVVEETPSDDVADDVEAVEVTQPTAKQKKKVSYRSERTESAEGSPDGLDKVATPKVRLARARVRPGTLAGF